MYLPKREIVRVYFFSTLEEIYGGSRCWLIISFSSGIGGAATHATKLEYFHTVVDRSWFILTILNQRYFTLRISYGPEYSIQGAGS